MSIPEVARCGLNSASPDVLTPERAAASIWTWAPNHPYAAYADLDPARQVWQRLKDFVQLLFVGQDPQVCMLQTVDLRYRMQRDNDRVHRVLC